jgi:hypothetical protein
MAYKGRVVYREDGPAPLVLRAAPELLRFTDKYGPGAGSFHIRARKDLPR